MFHSVRKLDRIKKINKLIRGQQTGRPEVFARKLNIGKRQLYNILDDLKIMGAPIKYCRKRETFYYLNDFDLQINYSVNILKGNNVKNIFDGSFFFK